MHVLTSSNQRHRLQMNQRPVPKKQGWGRWQWLNPTVEVVPTTESTASDCGVSGIGAGSMPIGGGGVFLGPILQHDSDWCAQLLLSLLPCVAWRLCGVPSIIS